MISRRGGRPASTLLIFVVFGIFAGAIYFATNQNTSPTEPAEIPLTSEPTFESLPVDSQSLQQATSVLSGFPQPTWEAPQVRLYIPKANVVAPIVPVYLDGAGSWNIAYLGHNVGHLQGTAWIYHPGNIALVGHVEHHDGTLGVFSSLSDLAYGDEILLQINSEQRIYSIDNVFSTSPDDTTVLYPTENDQLTLLTCRGYDFVTNTYAERLVAVAVRIS
ncbi:MAG: sortase [Anaerolineae bacterium]